MTVNAGYADRWLLPANDRACRAVIGMLLCVVVAVDTWRRAFSKRVRRLEGSLRKILRRWESGAFGAACPAPRRRHAHNRTPADVEADIVRLHHAHPELGAGRLRHLVYRVLGFRASRETIRKIVLRNPKELHKPAETRRVIIDEPRQLWGIDLTLVWVLGFFPVWVLGVVDYCGSRLVALKPLVAPRTTSILRVLERTFAEHGVPKRLLSDRGMVFRAEAFVDALRERGIQQVLTKPRHPWTNGRIERLFRTFKETIGQHFWLIRSRGQLGRLCSDFVTYYNTHRPHLGHDGRTPDEVYFCKPVQRARGHISFFEGRLNWWRLG